jgi:hypothetical protein
VAEERPVLGEEEALDKKSRLVVARRVKWAQQGGAGAGAPLSMPSHHYSRGSVDHAREVRPGPVEPSCQAV